MRVCLISNDLYTKTNGNDLCRVFDYVIVVKSIVVEGKYKHGKRFDRFYKPWIHYAFTRLQCLWLGKLLGLKKILVLDADTVVLGDMSELFNLPAPAGILSFQEGYVFSDTTVMHHAKLHGTLIDSHWVKEAVRRSYGIRGCLLLLEPNVDDFNGLIEKLTQQSSELPFAIGAYGDESCHIGPDERLLTEYYAKHYGWTHVHHKFCITAWHLKHLAEGEIPRCLHFVSQKPWQQGADYFEDFSFWYLEALHLLALYPSLKNQFSTSALNMSKVKNFSTLSHGSLDDFKPLVRALKSEKQIAHVASLFCVENSDGQLLFFDYNEVDRTTAHSLGSALTQHTTAPQNAHASRGDVDINSATFNAFQDVKNVPPQDPCVLHEQVENTNNANGRIPLEDPPATASHLRPLSRLGSRVESRTRVLTTQGVHTASTDLSNPFIRKALVEMCRSLPKGLASTRHG